MPETSKGSKHILVAIDHATRYVVIEPTINRNSQTVAKFLFKLMMRFGAPHEIITDRADCFENAAGEYLRLQATNHLPSTPYHPNTNGLTERVNGVIGSMLTKMTMVLEKSGMNFFPQLLSFLTQGNMLQQNFLLSF